ncbi:MAG: flagellar filament capping protein FliD [Christensenellales bacterium]|jgi:flagellar hook-associated protein 2
MSINSLNRTLIRLDGMSSGLDTSSIVSSLLTHERTRVDKQFQSLTKLEWRDEALRDVNLKLRNFRENNMSALKPESNVMSAAAYKSFKVSMLGDTSAVSVTASHQASAGRVTINSIEQLAQAAAMRSSNIMESMPTSHSVTLGDMQFKNDLEFADDSIAFSINGRYFEFSSDTTLNEMMSRINSDSDAGVSISFSELTQGFNISSKKTGSLSYVVIENIIGNAFAADGAFGIEAGIANGKDAKLTINNVEVVKENNNFTIDGITYSLKGEASEPINFVVEHDYDKTVEMIKGFVGAYNELISELHAKLDEKSYASSYPPLTDEQRKSLSETEQKKWDEMSRSGMLRNNGEIARLLDKMRNAFYTQVGASGKSPSSLGLTTGLYSDKGKITIDEATLRAAVQNNPEEVALLFTATSKSDNIEDKFAESGLVTRMSDLMLDYTSNSTKVTLYNLGEEIRRAEERLSQLEVRLYSREEALWKKYTAMETAMASLNSQSSWLAAQFTNQQ